MGENKKQHVVPKFYLKGFADEDNKIHQFSMRTGKHCVVDIKDACTRNYFYDIGFEENHEFEKKLSIIEEKQSVFLQNFLDDIRNFKYDYISRDVKRELINFMVFMYLRGFHTRENTNRAMESLLNTSLNFFLNHKDNPISCEVSSDASRDIHAKLTKEGEAMWHRVLFEDVRRQSEYLCNHDFIHIHCLNKDRNTDWKFSFYTSDNPVYLESLIDFGHYGIGLLLPGVFFIMSLSHDVLLILGDNNYKKQMGFNNVCDVTYLDTTTDEKNTCRYIGELNTKIVLAAKDLVFSSDTNYSIARMISQEKRQNDNY